MPTLALPTIGPGNASGGTNATTPGSQGSYWQGADGNVWVAGNQGTNSAGAWNPSTAAYWNNLGYNQIADPNAPTTGGGGGGSTTSGTLSPAEINAALAQIAAQQQTEQNQYNAAKTSNAGSDAQQAANEQLDVQNNTTARSTAIQNAEQAAASGNQGLRAVLASLGALGGTGQILADRAVANSANSDIGNADNTYTTNAQKIAEANDAYLTAKNQRDQALNTALQTDQQSTANSIYQNLINKAQNIGDTATANTYLSKLTGSETPVTPINAAQVLYNGADTAAYAPSSSVNVTAAPSGGTAPSSNTLTQSQTAPVNSALYTTKTGSTPA